MIDQGTVDNGRTMLILGFSLGLWAAIGIRAWKRGAWE